MIKLEKYIDTNFNEFSELSVSEVIHCEVNEFDKDIVDYLKSVDRFDYRGVCIYYVAAVNEVWIENML